ncbi:MAG: hypothetical protein IPP81_20135 [Chitinophagaceae bacterium]|nr:hypothetical protein [Chitinophagaceae bacterium]
MKQTIIYLLGILFFFSCEEKKSNSEKFPESVQETNKNVLKNKLSRDEALQILKQKAIGSTETVVLARYFKQADWQTDAKANIYGEGGPQTVSVAYLLSTGLFTEKLESESGWKPVLYHKRLNITTEGKKYVQQEINEEYRLKCFDLEIDNITGIIEEIPEQKIKVEYSLKKVNETPFSDWFKGQVVMKGYKKLIKYDDGWRVE